MGSFWPFNLAKNSGCHNIVKLLRLFDSDERQLRAGRRPKRSSLTV